MAPLGRNCILFPPSNGLSKRFLVVWHVRWEPECLPRCLTVYRQRKRPSAKVKKVRGVWQEGELRSDVERKVTETAHNAMPRAMVGVILNTWLSHEQLLFRKLYFFLCLWLGCPPRISFTCYCVASLLVFVASLVTADPDLLPEAAATVTGPSYLRVHAVHAVHAIAKYSELPRPTCPLVAAELQSRQLQPCRVTPTYTLTSITQFAGCVRELLDCMQLNLQAAETAEITREALQL